MRATFKKKMLKKSTIAIVLLCIILVFSLIAWSGASFESAVLNERIAHISDENVRLKSEVSELRSRHSTLEGKCSTLEAKYSTLEIEYSGLKSEHSELKSELSQLQSRYLTLEREHSSLEANYSTLKGENDELKENQTRLMTLLEKGKEFTFDETIKLDVKIREVRWGGDTIYGTVTNVGKVSIKRLDVMLFIFDPDGSMDYSYSEVLRDLFPGETLDFEFYGVLDEGQNYKILAVGNF